MIANNSFSKFFFLIILGSILMLATVGCLTSTLENSATISDTPQPATQSPASVQEPQPVQVTKLLPTPSIQTQDPTRPPLLTVTPMVISPTKQIPTASPPVGDLLSYNSEGIFQFSLETGQPTYLLNWPSDVLTKYASFSPDGIKVVFWQQTETTSELWFSELEPWSPELLLTLPETNYEFAVSDWLGTKRYIRFSLARPNELGIHTVVATYLIDTQKKEVVETLSGWETMCPILALSPRSKRAATWCSSDQGASYLVVETEGELWTTTEPPDQLLVNNEQNSLDWSWSNNAEHVVFTEILNDTFDKQLYFTSSENDLPIRLPNVERTHFGNLSLSTNGKYLSFIGTCPDGFDCTLIIHIPTGEIVWTSQAIPGLGIALVFAWSPDGNYFVTSDLDNFYIIELLTGQITQQIDGVRHETLVWK